MRETTTEERHAQQVAAWNGDLGAKWAAGEAGTDAALAPVTAALLARADARPGEAVLDVGCGGGGTTEALAAAVGPAGRVVGLDVSEPIMAVARSRLAGLAQVELVLADAAHWTPTGRRADLLFSRFGVMFFGDPVAAFARLRQALVPGARVAFACWRRVAENPWVHVPLRAIAGLVPPLPPPGPEDPGQFSFGDPARVARILTAAGFAPPRIEALDFHFTYPTGDLAQAATRLAGTGGVSRVLHDQPDTVRAAAITAIGAALAPHARPDRVELGASVWLVTSQVA